MHIDETTGVECPNCQVGRLHGTLRPYVEMFHGSLLTVPKAICYCCDSCNFYEYDDSIVEVINYMIVGASLTLPTDDATDTAWPRQGNGADVERLQTRRSKRS